MMKFAAVLAVALQGAGGVSVGLRDGKANSPKNHDGPDPNIGHFCDPENNNPCSSGLFCNYHLEVCGPPCENDCVDNGECYSNGADGSPTATCVWYTGTAASVGTAKCSDNPVTFDGHKIKMVSGTHATIGGQSATICMSSKVEGGVMTVDTDKEPSFDVLNLERPLTRNH